MGQPMACVSQARHDDVAALLEQSQKNHTGEKLRAAELESKVKELETSVAMAREELRQRDQALNDELERLAQVRFDADVMDREREDARLMNEQLRVELERVAGHLRAFADDKNLLSEQREQLAQQLDAAEQRLSALALDEKASQQRFTAARELALALAQPLEEEKVRLSLVDGNIAIQFPNQTVFKKDGATLTDKGQALLEKTAAVLSPLFAQIHVQQPRDATALKDRAASVAQTLVASGLDRDRLVLSRAEEKTEVVHPDETEEPSGESPETGAAELDVIASGVVPSDTELQLQLRFETQES